MKGYHFTTILILCAFLGFFLGNNFSVGFLKIKTDGIALDQLLTIVVTLGIGWYIPSKLSKVLEDKRIIKNLLVDEISSYLLFISGVKKKLNDCLIAGAISDLEKRQINLIFEESDLLLSNLQTQTEIIDKTLCNKAIDSYLDYHRLVTGGQLMNASFIQVDQVFYSEVVTEHYKLDITFKKLAQEVQLHK
nr:hypothetical protein [uncultured Pedobacter sp.]